MDFWHPNQYINHFALTTTVLLTFDPIKERCPTAPPDLYQQTLLDLDLCFGASDKTLLAKPSIVAAGKQKPA